jgi:hypothetical protein
VFIRETTPSFFNMIMPDPSLVLPLQRLYKALDLRLFHTLPAARIWNLLTSGCLELKRHISKTVVSHVMKKFKLLRPNGVKKSLKNFTPMGS